MSGRGSRALRVTYVPTHVFHSSALHSSVGVSGSAQRHGNWRAVLCGIYLGFWSATTTRQSLVMMFLLTADWHPFMCMIGAKRWLRGGWTSLVSTLGRYGVL
jgi:hypothetical protein